MGNAVNSSIINDVAAYYTSKLAQHVIARGLFLAEQHPVHNLVAAVIFMGSGAVEFLVASGNNIFSRPENEIRNSTPDWITTTAPAHQACAVVGQCDWLVVCWTNKAVHGRIAQRRCTFIWPGKLQPYHEFPEFASSGIFPDAIEWFRYRGASGPVLNSRSSTVTACSNPPCSCGYSR